MTSPSSMIRPWLATRSTTSTMSCRSTVLMRSCSESAVSAGSTGSGRWATTGPESIPASTTCTVQPVIVTPYSTASTTGCAPGKAGSSEGWVLSTCWGNAVRKRGPRIRMNPTETIHSGA
ncbi:MAG: hypothetical protein U0R64_04215 [Candidatus Nanopelagicales bacterium]